MGTDYLNSAVHITDNAIRYRVLRAARRVMSRFQTSLAQSQARANLSIRIDNPGGFTSDHGHGYWSLSKLHGI
jgi:hypothetical protein